MLSIWEFRNTDERPVIPFELRDSAGAITNCATATFVAKLRSQATGAVALTKTTGIIGAATVPNASIVWATGELLAVPDGVYWLELTWTIAGNDQSLPKSERPIVTIWS